MGGLKLAGAVILASSVIGGTAFAGPEKISFPEGYQTDFVRYTAVNKPAGRGPARVRFVYVNREALAKAAPGKPAPQGTVLVAEDYKAKLGADGKPMKDRHGKFISTGGVLNLFIQKKQPGWGAEYGSEKRNGEWEYARFNADGTRPTGPRVRFGRCFGCHLEKVARQDYNFTFAPFVTAVKK